MIVEQHSGGRHGPTYSCWITRSEYRNELLPAAPGYRETLAIRLGAESSLRAEEIANVEPQHIVEGAADLDERQGWFLQVPERKDTTGETGGKYGKAILPDDLKNEIDRFVNDRNIAPRDKLFGVGKRQIQRYVSITANGAAEETGKEDWGKVSTHDLRRFFAQTCLTRENLNPRVVMYIGGWSSMQALRPYLNAPEEGQILSEFAGVSFK